MAVRGGLGELRRRIGERVTVFAAVRAARTEGDTWVGSCEGSPREPFEVALPAALAGRLGTVLERYRYFTGVLTKGERAPRLVLASPDDVRAEPP